jgi:hypothetical protein
MKGFEGLGNKISTFLLSDTVSLKVLFDNVKNTVISASLMIGAFYVRYSNKPPFDQLAADPAIQDSRVLLARLLLYLGFTLMVLNMAQLYIIGKHTKELFLVKPEDFPDSIPGWFRTLPAGFLRLLLTLIIAAVFVILQLASIAVALLGLFRFAADVSH